MEPRTKNTEENIEHMSRDISTLTRGFTELTKNFSEFALFVKQQFEHQEKILETMSDDIKELKGRTSKIEETLHGIQHAFLFKAF